MSSSPSCRRCLRSSPARPAVRCCLLLPALLLIFIAVPVVEAENRRPTPQVLREHENYAFGSSESFHPSTDTNTWTSLLAREGYDAMGESFFILIYQDKYDSSFEWLGWRYLWCYVDRTALVVWPHRATVSAIVDAESPLCVTGTEGDIAPFSGAIAVSGEWREPLHVSRSVSTVVGADLEVGDTWTLTCQSNRGSKVTGEFWIDGVKYQMQSRTSRFEGGTCNRNSKR